MPHFGPVDADGHRLTFIHIPRSGGSWVGEQLRQAGGDNGTHDLHDPLWTIPNQERRHVVATIRDPWSWYVALYRFLAQSHGGIQNLRSWAGLEGPGQRPPFRAVLEAWTRQVPLPTTVGPGLALTFANMQGRRRLRDYVEKAHNAGIWSLGLHYWMSPWTPWEGPTLRTSDPLRTTYLDHARLTEGLSELLGRDLTDKAHATSRNHIGGYGPEDPVDWYTDETREWVVLADDGAIKHAKITECSKPANRPLLWSP